MPFTLTFWDQLGNPISVVEAAGSVDRSTTLRQRLVRPRAVSVIQKKFLNRVRRPAAKIRA